MLQDDRPGDDWLKGFMDRNNLSLKQPSTLEKARTIAASDLEIIYDYFEILETQMTKLKIENRLECVWNIDETNLFIDPSRSKVVATRGQKASRTTATSGREATTVMAGISAAGEKLPTMIIFKGVNYMSNWMPDTAYPGTQLARSENGWMNKSIFYDWFKKFCEAKTQRPLLLVYDRHSTHINLALITLAREQNVTLIKLPAHTTDKLQPLDVCCFRPLKVAWDKAIARWAIENNARRISKAEFIGLTGEVWNEVFKPDNIKKAFEKTGLFPVNREIYPKATFNPRLLAIYEEKQAEENKVPEHMPATPSKQHPTPLSTSPPPTPSVAQMHSTPVPSSVDKNISFEQLLCDKLTGHSLTAGPSTAGQNSESTKRKVNRRINPQAQVLTTDEFFNEIQAKEGSRNLTNKAKKPRLDEHEDEESSEDDLGVDLLADNSSDELDESDDSSNETIVHFNPRQYEKIIENLKVEKFYLVVYGKNLKYIGKITNICQEKVTISFLQRMPNEKYTWPNKPKIEDIAPNQIISGPINMKGTFPFSIAGVESSVNKYNAYIKEKQQN